MPCALPLKVFGEFFGSVRVNLWLCKSFWPLQDRTGLSTPQVQISITTMLPRKGQITRTFRRKSTIFSRNSQNQVAIAGDWETSKGRQRQLLPSSLGALDATSKVPFPLWETGARPHEHNQDVASGVCLSCSCCPWAGAE